MYMKVSFSWLNSFVRTKSVESNLPWIRCFKERSSQNSRPQNERAKGEEPLVTQDHNLVLEPVGLHVKLLCEDKRGAPI